MDEQTQGDSATVESRLSSFFASEAAPEETQAEPQQEAPPALPVEEEQQEVAPEAVEGEAFEVDGVEYRLPPELKAKVADWREGALRREDYTQKTQQLAELTRQAAAINEAFQVQKQFDEQIAPKRDELARVKHQLAQFKGVNWTDLTVEQHLSLRSQMEQLKDSATELEGSIKQEQAKFAEHTVGKKRELLETGHRYLSQAIKGWNEQHQESAISAARSVGFSDHEIGSVIDPRFVHMAYKAAMYDKLQGAKPAAVAAVQKAPPVVKPGASLGTGVAAETKYRDARAQLKKSGSLKDAARLLMR
jgi:hypothetical protein